LICIKSSALSNSKALIVEQINILKSLYTLVSQDDKQAIEGRIYKLDIKKYFYSIDRNILRVLFEKKIKDKRFVDLMCKFTEMDGGTGIPIGNLLSQIYASIYMNETDQFIKRVLKIKSYVRYVDDFILIGLTLDEAKKHKETLETFVKENLMADSNINKYFLSDQTNSFTRVKTVLT